MKKILYKTIMILLCICMITGSAISAAVVPATANTASPTPDPLSASTIKAALEEFKSLSRSERKLRVKEAKKELKAFKSAQKAGEAQSTSKLLLIILAVLLPPLAVFLHQGSINGKFWLSILLTILFWVPGVIYALIVILGEEPQ